MTLTWRGLSLTTLLPGESMVSRNNGFQAGGRSALRRALRAEIRQVERDLQNAAGDEERARAQSKLDELHRERDEVRKHSGKWLF